MTSTAKYSEQKIAAALKLHDALVKQGVKNPIPATARRMKLPPGTMDRWIKNRESGHVSYRSPNKKECLAELVKLLTEKGPDLPWADYKQLSRAPGAHLKHWSTWSTFRGAALKLVPDDLKTAPERVFVTVQRKPATLDELAAQLFVSRNAALRAIEHSRQRGYNIQLRGEHYQVENVPGQRPHDPKLDVFLSDDDGVLRYGVVSDNHIGSKYARLDVLNDLYDFFQREGITRVYNCGNWIDGEARFNKHDLEPWAHGLDNQIRGFIEHYPQRKGINTYYVAGDDHEGWYDGIDVGLRTQQSARDAGRTDLHYLGYMEAFVAMRNKRTGMQSIGAFVHPGGGSAYAISYSPQKIVESYQGGEKPAIVHLGHYHKMDVFNYRNVWIIQTGCTQDQTPFMRKKRIEAHVGGVKVELRLDARGAINDCITHQKRYFDRGYYNQQFDRAGPLGRIPLAA